MAPITLDGTIRQSAHFMNTQDYSRERMTFPVLGVVLNLHSPDSDKNASAIPKEDQRGYRWEATVLVVADGYDTPWMIHHAVVLPQGPSGMNNFQEALPRPSSKMVDGSQFTHSMSRIDWKKLDGDWCIVQFIGGQITHPIITHWFPHPSNVVDPATAAKVEGTLQQAFRYFKRYNGTKFVITNQGSIYIDTNESNSLLSYGEESPKRKESDKGGDVQLDIKSGRKFEVNFNKPVPLPESEPSLPQPNPPDTPVDQTREDTLSRLTMDKTFIEAVAKEVAKIIASDKIEIKASTIEEASSNILMGSDPSSLTNEDGVLTGKAIDPFTGKTHFVLGNASTKVKAEK